ncbi:MAG: 1-(5-phosphoribosyl)-5-[(5-phosphoribosylamino)methylideneamino]imidazole-4-carboxamide isomerase [Oscillospiraceae bacterium]|nr:1-(5-phosphoribosyl)-5-[(5-phosphoribosylamino)methylideneamino]imidazole-4-carboxamide isomerase [Oscillospiraceae bacterium]
MKIFPAIDLLGGKVVRLTRGDYDIVDVYGDNPLDAAKAFREQGAENLHIVDLDGARDGSSANFAVIESIAKAGGLFIQTGGGIRDAERVKRCASAGVNRVILGTVAAQDFGLLEQLIAAFGTLIAVGVDARDGLVAVKGWRETTALDSLEFCEKLDGAGVDNIIYTDISRDGTMRGANLEVYSRLAGRVGAKITASGGISGPDELETLAGMGVYAAILGKSLYTGAINLREAIKLCSPKG